MSTAKPINGSGMSLDPSTPGASLPVAGTPPAINESPPSDGIDARRTAVLKAVAQVTNRSPLREPILRGATQACRDAANTRATHSLLQSYNNCGLESVRIIINAVRTAQGKPPVSELDLFTWATANGHAQRLSTARKSGGAMPEKQKEILEAYGIKAHLVGQQSADVIRAAVDAGRPALVVVSGVHWFGLDAIDDHHTIGVTGVARDANNNVIGYYVNDTGHGECGQMVPAQKLEWALVIAHNAIIVDAPVWGSASSGPR